MNAMLQDLNVPEEGFTLRWIGKDGVTRWMESRIVPVRDEAGQLLAVEGITRDLTDRVNADNALKTSEHFLARAQKIAKLGNWTRDLIIGRSTWSDGLYAIYGHERQENDDVLKLWRETVHPDDKAHTTDLEKRFLAGESDYDTEYRIIRKDNDEVRIIHATAELIRDAQGTPIQVVGVAQDVTEQKQAEKELKESELRLRTLFEQAAVGVSLIETKTGRYIDINQKYCDLLGYTKTEMLNLTFQNISYPEDIEENVTNNKLLIEGKISEFTIEKRLVRKDGEIIWINLTVSPLWKPGEEPDEYIHSGFVQDITEHKLAEESLRKNEANLNKAQQVANLGSWTWQIPANQLEWSDQNVPHLWRR